MPMPLLPFVVSKGRNSRVPDEFRLHAAAVVDDLDQGAAIGQRNAHRNVAVACQWPPGHCE